MLRRNEPENHYINKDRPCTTTLKTKKEPSICQSLPCLDLVSFLVLNRIKPQAPLLEVPFRQSLHVSGLRPCSTQNHKTLISQLDVVAWVETIPLSQGLVFATRLQRPSKHARWDGMSFTNKIAGTQF